MNERRQQSAIRIIAWTFRCLVQAWPRSSRDWAVAMQSELSEMSNPQESFRWLTGGIMSLGKAWWNQVIYGWNENEKEPTVARTPGPAAFAAALIAVVVFFALPSVHEGFRAFVGSWRSNNNSHASEYKRMVQEAESNRDAKALAFFAARMDTAAENARLANEAVEIDPSLTWIYVRGGSFWYVYNHVGERAGWIQKLEAWDPENATVYLIEASIRDSKIRMQYNYLPPKDAILNDPAWRTAMQKAFAAQRYDTYYDRSLSLQQSVLKANNLRQPEDVVRGIVEYYPTGMSGAQAYSTFLLKQAEEAKEKGDPASAAKLAWNVAQFALRVSENTHNEWARGTANAMLNSSYEFLLPLETAAGHTDVTKLMAIQNDAFARRLAEKQSERAPYFRRSLDAQGIAIHSAGVGALLFSALFVLSTLLLLTGRFAPALRTGKTYRCACICVRYCPAGFLATTALMAAVFAPYLENLKNYVGGLKDAATLQALTATSESVYQIPSRVLNPMNYGVDRVYFWSALLAVVMIAGALFLTRNLLRRQTSPEAAA